MKKISMFIVGMFLLGIVKLSVLASPVESSPEQVIQAYVDAIDERDWEKFGKLHVEANEKDFQRFFANVTNSVECNGVLNITSAELTELIEINPDDAEEYIPNDDFEYKVYVAGMNLEVVRDTKYFSTGINYEVILCVLENDVWQIYDMYQLADPKKLQEKGYDFSDDYDAAIEVMDAREDGILMNYEGEVFGNAYGENESASRSILNTETVPTTSTSIRYYNAGTGQVQSLGFHYYCKGVTAGL